MLNAADSYVSKSTPPLSRQGSIAVNEKSPNDGASVNMTTSGRQAMTFSPSVHATSRQIKAFSGTATTVSNRTRDAVLGVATKVGDRVGKTTGIQQTTKQDGTVAQPTGIRGVLNRSPVAANVVLDGVTKSAEQRLKDGGEASGRVIEHRYGSEVRPASSANEGQNHRRTDKE
jgi:spartin